MMGRLVVVAVAVALGAGTGVDVAMSSRTGALPAGEIVFTRSTGGSAHAALYAMRADGSQVRLLARDASDAAVSRDGTRIAFVREGTIWVMGRDGSGQRRLTDPQPYLPGAFVGSNAVSDSEPAWSPDGRTLYFSRIAWKSARAPLYAIRLDGTGLRRVAAAPAGTGWGNEGMCDQEPAPSPDGRLLVYISVSSCTHGADRTLRAVSTKGGPTRLPLALPVWLRDYGLQYNSPAWAPRGDALAYVAGILDTMVENPESSGIYLSRTDRSRPERIILSRQEAGWITSLAWSGDGQWLAFSRGPRTDDVWLVRRDGTSLRKLTRTTADESGVAWLPAAHS